MAAVQYICAKVGMVYGCGLAGVIRGHYPRLLYPVVIALAVANTVNAGACPKCGAVQTDAGREKGQALKKQADLFAGITILVVCAPLFLCCLGIMFSPGKSSPPPKEPAGWDMDRLKVDVRDVVRDPNKTIFVPNDGGQPRVVPNPDGP
jgi:hypothetical protein